MKYLDYFFMFFDCISVFAIFGMWFFSVSNVWVLLLIIIYSFFSNCYKLSKLDKSASNSKNKVETCTIKNVYMIQTGKVKRNAYCTFNNIFIEDEFYNRLLENDVDINAVIFHEQYHLKKNHVMKKLFLKYILIYMIFNSIILSKRITILIIITFVAFYIYSIQCEYLADQYAVDNTSKEEMIKTLSLVTPKQKGFMKIDFFDIHPSVKNRISRIKRYKK